VQRQ
jgi:hypothetical protein